VASNCFVISLLPASIPACLSCRISNEASYIMQQQQRDYSQVDDEWKEKRKYFDTFIDRTQLPEWNCG